MELPDEAPALEMSKDDLEFSELGADVDEGRLEVRKEMDQERNKQAVVEGSMMQNLERDAIIDLSLKARSSDNVGWNAVKGKNVGTARLRTHVEEDL
ncbi:hypothetical protein Dimus_027403 [Dionaea muscipula]